MADDVCLQIENALYAIVNITDKTWNLIRKLNYEMHETVIKLSNLVASLECNIQKT